MSRFDWFDDSGLGLFIHWGLYAIPAKGEWHLWKNRVPLDEYDALAERFAPPDTFSPERWVLLAKRMGAKYAVLTTRHHDGFCLWNTKTTDFNSVKTAARRDFVREFADACRRHGIRVGFYYSIMNWQFRKRMDGANDDALWAAMVENCHAALRELMTDYGKVDLLWYDGCSAPGVDDAEALDRVWRAKELNAMVRSLQPEIVINDRSGQPEDYSTPEQSLAAPPRGRRWEACMTVNDSWGYTADDKEWKSSETLIRSALHCARFGGRMLLNVGPRADGSVPEECVRRLEALGEYIAAAPQAFHGAVRDDWTEATHEAGVVVKTGEGYFLHDFSHCSQISNVHKSQSITNDTNANGTTDGASSPSEPPNLQFPICEQLCQLPFVNNAKPRLDGAESLSPVAPGVWSVRFRAGAKPCNWLGGRHDVEIKAGSAPVLGDASDHYAPPEGKLVSIGTNDTIGTIGNIATALPAGGRWRLEIGFVNDEGFKDTFATEVDAAQGGPSLPAGVDRATVYACRLSPLWRIVPPSSFELAGKFPSPWYRDVLDIAPMAETMAQDMPALAAEARFEPLGKRNALCDRADEHVNFAYGAPDAATLGFGLARTTLRNDRDRTVMACIGQDWWSDVYLNGVRLLPVEESEGHGCKASRGAPPAFSGHKPIPFLLPLRAGDNELLVVNHGGNRANWFALWTNL